MSLKVGLIGCANTALKNFLPSIEFSNTELGFIASRSLIKAEEWAERFQSKKFGNYDEIIESDVDMIYMPLPVGLHEEWIIKAAESGKHILCEKSAVTSFESAKKIIDICKKNHVRILEAFSYRFHPQHEYVKQLIKNEIGVLQNFIGRFSFSAPPKENIRWNKKLGGGVLNDAACYPISACRMLLEQEPNSVFSNLMLDSKLEVDTNAEIFFKFSNGKSAFILSGFDSYYQSRYEIVGNKGKISTNRAYAVPSNYTVNTFFEKDDKSFEKKFSDVNQFGLMFEEFCNVISNKKENSFGFEMDLLEQAKVMEAVRISSNEKREVFLSEFN
jgi:hypothetical protein